MPGPIIAAGVAAAGAAIGGLLGLVQNSLDDDWAETTVFESHAREIHSAMIGIQCIVGGAQLGAPLQDSTGNVICPGGTQPTCRLTTAQLGEWRTLRDGFGNFWADVASGFGDPTNAEAQRLKDYAISFYNFYAKIVKSCSKQGTDLPVPPAPPKPPVPPGEGNAFAVSLKYGAWIVGGVACIWLMKSLHDVFGKGR